MIEAEKDGRNQLTREAALALRASSILIIY